MSGTNFRGGRKPFPKPSAFESEIHPSHKTPFCTLGISPCRGQIHASVNLQSERAGMYLSMPPQRTGRMDAVAADGYILGRIHSNICGTSQTAALWRLLTEKAAVLDYPPEERKIAYEEKFIYRNGKTA